MVNEFEDLCPCYLSYVRNHNRPDEHEKENIDLSDLPLYVVQELKTFFVKKQMFAMAVKCRDMEKKMLGLPPHPAAKETAEGL